MERYQVRELIVQELPIIMQEDRTIQAFVLELMRGQFAEKEETESRFDRVLRELERDREVQMLKWEENDLKWKKNQAVLKQMLAEIKATNRKHDQTIGALGARWGLHSEGAFRNGLKGILEDFFGVKVQNYLEFDEKGEVFGRPDQIELDLIIKNGLLIIAEIKSSMSRNDMYAFGRKVDFYTKRHERKPNRVMVISPMVEPRAYDVAKDLGIAVYSYVEEIDPVIFDGSNSNGSATG